MLTASPVTPVLKSSPEEFRVVESVVLALDEAAVPSRPKSRYLRLRKRGFTTFEAIEAIADALSISSREVGYAGLKDEDAVTEQVVSVPASVRDATETFNATHGGADRWLSLQDYGAGAEPMSVGNLNGNSFKIVVRDVDPAVAQRLAERRTVSHLFLNYYDSQRFGVPGGPRTTHLLGGALLAGKWEQARQLLLESGAPEARVARGFSGSAEELFDSLDPRVVSFYQCSAASATWNDLLDGCVTRLCEPAQIWLDATTGIGYRFARLQQVLARLAGDTPELPYTKYRWNGEAVVAQQSVRTTVVQTFLRVEGAAPDVQRPGRSRIGLSFFLPSGCYATSAVRQLFARSGWEPARG